MSGGEHWTRYASASANQCEERKGCRKEKKREKGGAHGTKRVLTLNENLNF